LDILQLKPLDCNIISGVVSFQTNFYIDDGNSTPAPPRNPSCDLCHDGHDAVFACSSCPSKFCSDCHSVHAEICPDSVVYELADSSGSQVDLPTKVKVVSAKVQRLEKLTEVTPMLTRDLNATQEKNNKLRSDFTALQTEHAALKMRHVNTESSLRGLQNFTGARFEGLERLQDIHSKQLQEEQRRLQEAISIQYRQLEEELGKLRSDQASRLNNLQHQLNDCNQSVDDVQSNLNWHCQEYRSLKSMHETLSIKHFQLDDSSKNSCISFNKQFSHTTERLNNHSGRLDDHYSCLFASICLVACAFAVIFGMIIHIMEQMRLHGWR
jgi:hypothetical protein